MTSAAPISLSSPRLLLRPFQHNDARALHELVRANHERLLDSFPNLVGDLLDMTAAQRWIENKAIAWQARSGYFYGIFDRTSQRLLGQIHLKNLDWNLDRAELAYWLDGSAEGHGLMSEAVNVVLQAGFTDLQLAKVFLRTIVDNTRSEALARRFGFRFEGTLRREYRTGRGLLVDVHYFGLLADEFEFVLPP